MFFTPIQRHSPLILWVFFAYAYHVRAISSQCVSSEDCAMENAVCQDNECTCSDNYVPDSYYTKCLRVRHSFGEACEDNLQCSTGFSTGGCCTNGTCACLDGYHYFFGKCWKTSGLGETCDRDEQCFVSEDFEASVCSENNVCTCADGYYQREYSSCRKIRTNPGDPCGITPDCQFSGGVCDSNRTCNSSTLEGIREVTSSLRHEKSEQLFLTLVETSNETDISCSTSSDCPSYSTCSGGICLCDSGFYQNGSTCCPEIGSTCEQDSDCLGKNTECSSDNNYCVCKNGFVVSSNRRFCHKLSRHLGWSCLTDVWCTYFGPRSICSNKKCACDDKSRYVENQVFCWIQLNVGDACQSDLDCGDSGNVTCTNDVCTCLTGLHSSSDNLTCRSDANLNETCTENVDCTVGNSTCSSDTNTCVCSEGYLEVEGNCVPGITGSCQESSDCTVDSSSCVDGSCSCNSTLVASQNLDACLKPVNISENCTETVQCSHLDAECLEGHCLCPASRHYVSGWSCFKSVELGEACEKMDECYVANSECSAYTCSCVYGYTAVDGECSGSISQINFISSTLVVFLLCASRIV